MDTSRINCYYLIDTSILTMYKQRSIRLSEIRDTALGKIANELGVSKQEVMNIAFDQLINSKNSTKGIVDPEIEALLMKFLYCLKTREMPS